MIFSLPSYRRLSDLDLARLRLDDERNPSWRAGRMLLNLLLLSGLWGMPLYARWLVLADQARDQPFSEAVLGKWWLGDRAILEFTPNRHLRLCGEKGLIETAEYQIVNDTLWVDDFKRQPGDVALLVKAQCFQITIRDNQLIVRPAKFGFTPIPRHGWEDSVLRRLLPEMERETRQFHRSKRAWPEAH